MSAVAGSLVVYILIYVTGLASASIRIASPINNLESESHGHEHDTLHCSALDPPQYIFKPMQQDSTTSRRKRSVSLPQAIRIMPVFDSSVESLSNSDNLKSLVWQATDFFRQALLVRVPATSPIFFNRVCDYCYGNCPYNCSAPVTCNVATIPTKYLEPCNVCGPDGQVNSTISGSGASNTDYLLFVTAISTYCGSSTIAYATACSLDSMAWRPNTGMVNICPILTSGNVPFDPKTASQIIIHEMTHALGFTKGLFPFYIDDNGEPLTPVNPSTGLPPMSGGSYVWSSNITVTKTVSWQTASGFVSMAKTYLVTPTVRNFVREFFNCSTMVGAELEDQGGSGTALSHWEKRIFMNEYMAGVISEDIYISPLTLSLLQDTGWYYANFSVAEPYSWGRGLGCGFATQSCLTWINSQKAAGQNPIPFCNTFDSWYYETRTTCDPQQSAVRYCNLGVYSTAMSSTYRYFAQTITNSPYPSYSASYYGGSIYVADYCPYYSELLLSSQNYSSSFSNCKNSYSNLAPTSNYGLQASGSTSLCLRQKTPNFFYQCGNYSRTTAWGAGCYQVTCSDSMVTVTINDQTLICTSELQQIKWTSMSQLYVSGFSYTPFLVTGTVVCPQCDNACPNKACPMTRVNANSTTLIDTDQTYVYYYPISHPIDTPCYNATVVPITSTSTAARSTTGTTGQTTTSQSMNTTTRSGATSTTTGTQPVTTTTRTVQNPCAHSNCPNGTYCLQSGNFQYVCECYSNSTELVSSSVQLNNCYSSASRSSVNIIVYGILCLMFTMVGIRRDI